MTELLHAGPLTEVFWIYVCDTASQDSQICQEGQAQVRWTGHLSSNVATTLMIRGKGWLPQWLWQFWRLLDMGIVAAAWPWNCLLKHGSFAIISLGDVPVAAPAPKPLPQSATACMAQDCQALVIMPESSRRTALHASCPGPTHCRAFRDVK